MRVVGPEIEVSLKIMKRKYEIFARLGGYRFTSWASTSIS